MGRRDLRGRIVVALAALMLLAAPAAGLAEPQSALDPASPQARAIHGLWWFLLIVSVVVVAVIWLLVLMALLSREGTRLDRLAQRFHSRKAVGIGGFLLPLIVLLVTFGLTLDVFVKVAPSSTDAQMRIEVTARQWFWDVRYPGAAGAVTANEIHIPTGVPVDIALRTEDVIHSFWAPRLNRKIDAIPGTVNHVTLQADRPGVYRGQCAEFCGLQHANMAFLVVADEPARFEAWLRDQAQPADVPVDPSAARGKDVFMANSCAACHTIRGTEADGNVGPDLTHLASRESLAAVTIPNTRGDLGGWILDPQHIKPGNKMPGTNLDGDEVQALLDYLESLE